MKMVNIAEAKAQLSELLDTAASGERVVICKRNQPVAEIRPVAAPRSVQRPLGLAAGSVTLTPAFFEPLPEDVLGAFEVPVSDRDAVRRATKVAEPRRPGLERSSKPRAERAPRVRR